MAMLTLDRLINPIGMTTFWPLSSLLYYSSFLAVGPNIDIFDSCRYVSLRNICDFIVLRRLPDRTNCLGVSLSHLVAGHSVADSPTLKVSCRV